MIGKVFFHQLTNNPAVNALVGGRISPVIGRNLELPYITYQKISGNPDHTRDDYSGFTESRFQLDCWAKSYAEAETLAAAIRKPTKQGGPLDGFCGESNGVKVLDCLIDDEADDYEEPKFDEQTGTYRARFDFLIWTE